jgi:Ribbon-helix-helix domain
MRKTLGPPVLAHLESDKLALLDELSVLTGVPRAVLIREAIDDLLKKHREVWKRTGPKTPSARSIHRVRLAKAARRK